MEGKVRRSTNDLQKEEIKHLKELYRAKVGQISPKVLATMKLDGSKDASSRTKTQQPCIHWEPVAPSQTSQSASSHRNTILDPICSPIPRVVQSGSQSGNERYLDKLRFPLQSIESPGFNEGVRIDHQKIYMTATGYNQVLVMIDHFTKHAEAAPCMTASVEETCNHLINIWIARHDCPITFQSENGKVFVGDLSKELMKRSQVAQSHSTTYHPQTNGPVEVHCSRYMDDWDRRLPQVMGAYNSTEHSTSGISPHMMLTGHQKALPLTSSTLSTKERKQP